MNTKEAGLRWLGRLGLVALVGAILGGMLLPVYSDEIGWRLQERAGLDGVDKMYDALCGPGTALAPPFWMMPVRWYSAVFNSGFAEPFYVRVSGVLYALVGVAILAGIVRRAAGDEHLRRPVAMVAAGLGSLGVMPLLWVWSRPEQPIVLALLGAVLLSSAGWSAARARSSPGLGIVARPLVIVALGVVALSYHFKAVFLLPALLACIVACPRGKGSFGAKAASATLLVGLSAWAARYWLARLACSNPLIAANMAVENLGATLLAARTPAAIFDVIGKLLHHLDIFAYVGLAAPRPDPMSDWLPADRIGGAGTSLWYAALTLLWLAALSIAAVGLVKRLVDAARERRVDEQALVALGLLASALGWIALQQVINVYEAIFVVPLLLTVLVLGLGLLEPHAARGMERALRSFAVIVSAAGIGSVAAIAAIYGPALVSARFERGYLLQQPSSVSLVGYRQTKATILAAGQACGITPGPGTNRLLIDDVTYFAYMRTRLPDHVIMPGSKMPSPDHPTYMKAMHSSGAVLSCRRLPADLRDRAIRTGDYCCVPPIGS